MNAMRGLPNKAALPPNPKRSPASASSSSSPTSSSSSLQPQCFDPLPWSTYFDRREVASVDERGSFCYYLKESRLEDINSSASELSPPLVFLLHGGGFCGLSWAALCSSLVAKIVCRCVAMDIRGHGDTRMDGRGDGDDEQEDFSLEALACDAAAVLKHLLEESAALSTNPPSSIVLIGHSMGGAVATHLAHSGLCPLLPIGALVVIDVVEGSAMEALSSMRGYLASRPSRFPSLPVAIQWCHRSGTVRNLDSARVSFPGHLKRVDPSPAEPAGQVAQQTEQQHQHRHGGASAAISEVPEEEEAEEEDRLPNLSLRGPALLNARSNKPPLPMSSASATRPSYRSPQQVDPNQPHYTWRIDLGRTETYWSGWFAGMSKKFLDAPTAKLLLLAGVDRLDRELTVGQMQGKFQMQVLPRSGHAVHEDHPEHVAEVLASFLVRHKLAKPLADFHPVPPGC